MPEQTPSRPLDGMIVADFSRVLAGPLATMTLADLGADVIKVERPGSGDDTRHWGPPWTDNSSSYYESANRSKRSIALDLSDADDRAVAVELTRRADVVVENFLPGSLAKYALDYNSVASINPRVVYASLSGFGSAEGARLPGYDFLVQAVGGLMDITGPVGTPSKVGVAIVDVLAGKDLTIAILAALAERERSGLGQHVETALLPSLLAGLVNQASSFHATGEAPTSRGNQHPSITPYETLQASDGLIAVAVGNDAQFRRLAEAVGLAELADDDRFARNADRVGHRQQLVDELECALQGASAAEWIERLTEVGVPAGAIGTVADGFDLAQRLGLDPVVAVDDGIAQTRSPLRLSRTPVDNYRRPPRLGEHSDEIRTWLETKG